MITHTIQAKRLKALAKKKKALWASSPQVARAIEEGDMLHLRAIHQLREHDFTMHDFNAGTKHHRSRRTNVTVYRPVRSR